LSSTPKQIEHVASYRARKLASGLCRFGGCYQPGKVKPNGARSNCCDEHTRKQSAYVATLRARRGRRAT